MTSAELETERYYYWTYFEGEYRQVVDKGYIGTSIWYLDTKEAWVIGMRGEGCFKTAQAAMDHLELQAAHEDRLRNDY